MGESALEQAERHVRECQQRVERQAALLVELDADGHAHKATVARSVLQTMEETLRLARDHLALEREQAIKP